MFPELVNKTRSFRRFQQEPRPSLSQLRDLVDLARQTPSAANKQPLQFVLVQRKERLSEVFSCLKWAGYLTDWAGPSSEEEPTAYIIVLSNPELNPKPSIDVGIASQTILLGAQALGFAGCFLGSIDRPKLRSLLELPENLEIELAIALGTPGEEVQLTTVGSDQSIRYWRDQKGTHYVPKRTLAALICTEL